MSCKPIEKSSRHPSSLFDIEEVKKAFSESSLVKGIFRRECPQYDIRFIRSCRVMDSPYDLYEISSSTPESFQKTARFRVFPLAAGSKSDPGIGIRRAGIQFNPL